jgi:hypothetical protein
MDHVWTCRCCGKEFNTLPLSFGPIAPDPWLAISETERGDRTLLGTDQCVIDDREFFIRGCLEIPIRNCDEPFVWSVWVSVSEKSFARIGELWDAEIRDQEPPFFGWLSNGLSVYPPTFGLKTNVHLRNSGRRPFIELEPTNHPLAVEQRKGISLRRIEEIAAALLTHQ